MTYIAPPPVTLTATVQAANAGIQTTSALEAFMRRDGLGDTELSPRNGLGDTYLFGGPRYAVVTSTGLIMLLAGCPEPKPDPIANEAQLSANQSPCSPDSQSPYRQHQALVLSEMQDMRAEGHHSDQALFVIGIGAALLFGLAVGYALGRRSGKRSERRRVDAPQAHLQTPPATERSSLAPRIGE